MLITDIELSTSRDSDLIKFRKSTPQELNKFAKLKTKKLSISKKISPGPHNRQLTTLTHFKTKLK